MADKQAITRDLIFQARDVVPQERVKPLKEARHAFEKSYLIHLLEVCQGNVTEAAKVAGKYRSDLYDLLAKHNLKPDDFRQHE